MPPFNSKSLRQAAGRVDRFLDVKNQKNRTTITLLAFAVFLAGLFVSLHGLDGGISADLTFGALGGMLVLLVSTFMINACRTHAHSRIVGAELRFGENAKISLFGSAMNMLPLVIPAGLYMRMSNFVRHGGETKHVVGVLVVNYFLSLCSSLLLGIGMLVLHGFVRIDHLFAAVALIYVGVAIFFMRLAGVRLGLAIAAMEISAVMIDAVRILVCFGILGFGIEVYQATILTISAIVGSAVSIVPAGLGVREILGAAVSPLIQVPPEQTYLALALNRVFGMLFFVGLSGGVLWFDRMRQT